MTLVRSSRSDGQATISLDQNPPAGRRPQTLIHFAFFLSLSSPRSFFLSAAAASGDQERAWRRRRLPRRRARSPTGERAAVEGPSRGALGQSPRKPEEQRRLGFSPLADEAAKELLPARR